MVFRIIYNSISLSFLNMKKKLIIITGTPGTGKSTLARKLAQALSFKRLDLHRYYPTISSHYDRRKKCYVVDMNLVEKIVQEKLADSQRGVIFDSHLSHLMPQRIVDLCIVLICSDLKKLKKRLQQRKYSEKKIRENLDAEIFQVCLVEAKERGHRVIVLDTSKRLHLKDVLKRINICA